MSRARIVPSLLVGSLLLVSVPAFAQQQPPQEEPAKPHFGDAGQFALSLNEGFALNVTDILNGSEIQASYFVAPHLSLGLMVGAQWLSSSPIAGSTSSEFIFRVGPRIGYDIALSDYVSIWPQVGLDYRRNDESSNENVPAGSSLSSSSTASAFGFTAVAPVLIHPTRGFFIGAGPFVYTEFTNSTSSGSTSTDNSKITSVGLMATIGGAI